MTPLISISGGIDKVLGRCTNFVRACLTIPSIVWTSYKSDPHNPNSYLIIFTITTNKRRIIIASILHVDDEPLILDSTKKYLELTTEFQIDSVHSGAEALEKLGWHESRRSRAAKFLKKIR